MGLLNALSSMPFLVISVVARVVMVIVPSCRGMVWEISPTRDVGQVAARPICPFTGCPYRVYRHMM